jgi:hypothetical protein
MASKDIAQVQPVGVVHRLGQISHAGGVIDRQFRHPSAAETELRQN